MKTIEVNLIGDLKQKTAGKKASPVPAIIAGPSTKPSDARNNLILFIAGGIGVALVAIFLLVGVATLLFSLKLEMDIAKLDEEINVKNAQLTKYTKIKNSLIKTNKELTVKLAVKKLLDQTRFPLGDILEELRAKIPGDITLSNVVKSKNGLVIKGAVSSATEDPLKSVSLFVLNINSLQPSDSLVRDAILATITNKSGEPNFAIKAVLVEKPGSASDEQKDKSEKSDS